VQANHHGRRRCSVDLDPGCRHIVRLLGLRARVRRRAAERVDEPHGLAHLYRIGLEAQLRPHGVQRRRQYAAVDQMTPSVHVGLPGAFPSIPLEGPDPAPSGAAGAWKDVDGFSGGQDDQCVTFR
jgi:hypothetical protein